MTDAEIYVHLMLIAIVGYTGEHLRKSHRIDVTNDIRQDAAKHMIAHGIPLSAHWSPQQRRFIRRGNGR
jgi:hypothetical protein